VWRCGSNEPAGRQDTCHINLPCVAIGSSPICLDDPYAFPLVLADLDDIGSRGNAELPWLAAFVCVIVAIVIALRAAHHGAPMKGLLGAMFSTAIGESSTNAESAGKLTRSSSFLYSNVAGGCG